MAALAAKPEEEEEEENPLLVIVLALVTNPFGDTTRAPKKAAFMVLELTKPHAGAARATQLICIPAIAAVAAISPVCLSVCESERQREREREIVEVVRTADKFRGEGEGA